MQREEYAVHKTCVEPSRGYYSEDMVFKEGEVFEETKDLSGKRLVHFGMLTKRMFIEKYAPVLNAIADPPRKSQLQPALRWKQFSTRVAISFPIQTIKPKVQLLLRAGPGDIPREVEVERRLRQYSKKSITEMLTAAGLEMWYLVPTHVMQRHLSPAESQNGYTSEYCRFPLEWFDNHEYDCMRPSDWLDLGMLRGERHPIPADAFLPNQFRMLDTAFKPDESVVRILRNNLFKWVKVSVQAYDERKMRWLVTDLETAGSFRIPRVFLMFLAEDPANFVERILEARRRRANADRQMKLELIVDSMILTGVPEPDARLMRRIYAQTVIRAADLRNEAVTAAMRVLDAEVRLDYQRTIAGIELREILRIDAAEYDSFLELPDEEPPYRGTIFRPECRIASFREAFEWLRINQVYCLTEVINAMDNVVQQCAHVGQMLFFTTQLSKTASLVDFRGVQEQTSANAVAYIKNYWIENLSGLLCMCLRSVGKGWFDIRTTDWGIYLFSKMSRLMLLIKLHMQIALRNLVEGSVRLWMQMLCKPCECLVKVDDGYTWNPEDLINSPFMPDTLHVFYLVLQMDEDGPLYSSDPLDFEPTLVKLFDEPLRESHFVHVIDPLGLAGLMFADDLFLSSVGLTEAVVADARDLLHLSYRKAVVPLLAYLHMYREHSAFYLMDKQQYLRDFKEADKSPQEYQDEISMHFRLKTNLEVTLPTSIQIGPFLIQTEQLKTFLVAKRQELAQRLIELLLEKLKSETQDIIGAYADITRRLAEKPPTIEHIFETREWMETLPDTINALETQMRLKLFEYDILDHFWTALPNDDFMVKWSALAGPMRCYRQMVVTREMYEEETERFLKQQTSDLVMYDEKVEGMNMTVSQFSSQFNTAKTTEIAIDIKKQWKAIVETMDLGRVLNNRQRLFENPLIDMSPIDQLRDSFAPYRTLWVTGADFIKWEEAWLCNPLPNVEVEKVRTAVGEYKASIEECLVTFVEMPKVRDVAVYFHKRIEEFEPIIDVIEWIKNPAWIMMHWQELTRVTGVEIKYSTAMTFDYCVTKGIMKFYDVVRQISESATANRERMEFELAEEERLREEAEREIIERKNRRRGRKLT